MTHYIGIIQFSRTWLKMRTGPVETYKITILVVLRDFFLGELFVHCGLGTTGERPVIGACYVVVSTEGVTPEERA